MNPQLNNNVSENNINSLQYNVSHIENIFSKHSQNINIAYDKNTKIYLSIKGKRKINLLAKAWLCNHRGYRWFTIKITEFKANKEGFDNLISCLKNLSLLDTQESIRSHGK